MIKTTLGAQRYNNKMNKIFEDAMKHMTTAKNGKMYDVRYFRENKKGEIVKYQYSKYECVRCKAILNIKLPNCPECSSSDGLTKIK